MGFDTIYLLKRSKSLQLSLDGLSSHLRPRGCKLREVQLQLWVLHTFRQVGTLGSPLQVFARIFAHGGNPKIVRLRRSRLFERPVPWPEPWAARPTPASARRVRLAARCEAALRRYHKGVDKNPIVRTGPLVIDLVSRSVSLGEKQIPLTRKEFQLLHLLAVHLGLVVTHEQSGGKSRNATITGTSPPPRRSRTAKASHISRHAAKSRCAREWGGWGRLSDDGPGHYNPDPSAGPWVGGVFHRMAVQ
jgi:hypothetical protein